MIAKLEMTLSTALQNKDGPPDSNNTEVAKINNAPATIEPTILENISLGNALHTISLRKPPCELNNLCVF